MKKNYEFSYKNEGNVSFLTVHVSSSGDLVRYQVKMMSNNDIPTLLPMNFSEHNGETELYYDITSRSALSQVISRGKLNKNQTLSLIEAFVKAGHELPEYQLSLGSIIFDPDYIFVRTGDFNVNFVFVPDGSEGDSIEPIRSFLSELIMKNKILAGNDTFLADLIEVINNEAFDINLLKRFCLEHRDRNKSAGSNQNKNNVIDPVNNGNYTQGTTGNSEINTENKFIKNYYDNNDYKQDFNITDITSSEPDDNKITENKKGKRKKSEKKQTRSDGDGSGNTKKRIIFIVIQGILVVLVGLAAQNGIFNDKKGNFDVTMLAGVLLICFLVDFLLFRRMFTGKSVESNNSVSDESKNKKSQRKINKKSKEKVENKKNSTEMQRPLPKSPFSQNSASGTSKNEKDANDIENDFRPSRQQEEYGMNEKKPERKKSVTDSEAHIPATTPKEPVYRNDHNASGVVSDRANISDSGYDATVLMEDNVISGARFTWYENGLLKRVKMDKNVMLAGRQANQVDIMLPGRMVGHIHAEFRRNSDGSQYTVIDCNSKNGTYINGSKERIKSNVEYPIRNGDTVKLADVELKFEC